MQLLSADAHEAHAAAGLQRGDGVDEGGVAQAGSVAELAAGQGRADEPGKVRRKIALKKPANPTVSSEDPCSATHARRIEPGSAPPAPLCKQSLPKI
jgi:hypothetical protein